MPKRQQDFIWPDKLVLAASGSVERMHSRRYRFQEPGMRGTQFLTRLREQVLIGDGALGTLISERGIDRETSFERLNLSQPEFIKDLHGAYLEAGAVVLETNTFGANRTKLLLHSRLDA